MKNKRLELAQALKEEYLKVIKKLPSWDENIAIEFDTAINYLETSEHDPNDVEIYGLLDACVNNFDTIYNDYCGTL